MFGKRNPNSSGSNSGDTPEGQAGYIPIDDAADLPPESAVDQTDELISRLRAEAEAADDRWKRSLADFQNYQRRSIQNENEARRQGVTAVLQSVIPVLDHFDLALAQKATDQAAVSILEGVKVIRGELLKALETHGVRVINPAPNSEFDPIKHQAISQQAAEGVGPGHISAVFQPGYELNERVIRSAKVSVAP